MKSIITKTVGVDIGAIGYGQDGMHIKRLTSNDLCAATKFAEENQMTEEFRLLDADGNVYFYGRCVGLDDADGDEAFALLDAMQPLYGVTEMQYRQADEVKWKTL